VADYEAGMSVVATGKKHRVSDETVVRWLKVNGISVRPQKVSLPKNKHPEILRLRVQGWSWTKIGGYYGCSRQAVPHALKRD
jgi:hypothetical protein